MNSSDRAEFQGAASECSCLIVHLLFYCWVLLHCFLIFLAFPCSDWQFFALNGAFDSDQTSLLHYFDMDALGSLVYQCFGSMYPIETLWHFLNLCLCHCLSAAASAPVFSSWSPPKMSYLSWLMKRTQERQAHVSQVFRIAATSTTVIDSWLASSSGY